MALEYKEEMPSSQARPCLSCAALDSFFDLKLYIDGQCRTCAGLSWQRGGARSIRSRRLVFGVRDSADCFQLAVVADHVREALYGEREWCFSLFSIADRASVLQEERRAESKSHAPSQPFLPVYPP